MKQWIVASGGEQWVGEGDSAFDAAVSAIKRRPPTSAIGMLITAREPHIEEMSDECWMLSTERVLDAAGLTWRKRADALN